MAEGGARVAIGDIHAEKAAETAEEIGRGTTGKPLDVTNREDFELFLDQVEAEFGPIDCLVNNAGVMLLGPVDEETPEATRAMIDVNLVGVINGTQAAMDRMKPRRRGRIVNIASQAGKAGMAGGATYCATKFGVIGFSEAVRARAEGNRRFDLLDPSRPGQHRPRCRTAGHSADGHAARPTTSPMRSSRH